MYDALSRREEGVGMFALWTPISNSGIFDAYFWVIHADSAGTSPRDFACRTRQVKDSRHEPVEDPKERRMKTTGPNQSLRDAQGLLQQLGAVRAQGTK